MSYINVEIAAMIDLPEPGRERALRRELDELTKTRELVYLVRPSTGKKIFLTLDEVTQ